MNGINFDTETTGIDEPEVFDLAFVGPFDSPASIVTGGCQVGGWRPSKPISLGAMAAHHVIDEDLVDRAPWPGRWDPPAEVTYLVGHNVDYDWKAIGSPEVRRICTLALSRYLWPSIDTHTLTAMTYYLQGRVRGRELVQKAHNAEHDVYLCTLLLFEILKLLPGMMSWDQLWRASEVARVPIYMSFGKYGPHEDWAKANGGPMKCAEVRRRDPGYYGWLMSKCDQVRDDPYLRKALTGEP